VRVTVIPTDARAHLRAVDGERLGEGGDDPLGDRHDVALAVEVLAQHDELVTAEARDGVVGPHRHPQPAGGLCQQHVAGGVAQRVVDDLEAVEVDEHDRDHLARLRSRRASALRRWS
jgi:hypothetical protein